MKVYAEQLLTGQPVTFNPRGNSMVPLIRSGETVVVEPCVGGDSRVVIGSILLCKVKGKYFLHKVYAIGPDNNSYLIGNNKGYKNGWTRTIYGIVTKIGA